jgi:hypothetical protein
VQRGMGLPPAYQQAITDSLQGQPTGAQQGGMPAQTPQQIDPQKVLMALQQGQVDLATVAQMVAAGALDINALGQLDPNLATQIVQMLEQMQAQGGGGQPPIGGGQPMGGGPMGANIPMQAGPNMPGGPPAAVYGGPNVQAAPGTPQPNSAAGAHVGRTVRPSGIATGREPGPRPR